MGLNTPSGTPNPERPKEVLGLPILSLEDKEVIWRQQEVLEGRLLLDRVLTRAAGVSNEKILAHVQSFLPRSPEEMNDSFVWGFRHGLNRTQNDWYTIVEDSAHNDVTAAYADLSPEEVRELYLVLYSEEMDT